MWELATEEGEDAGMDSERAQHAKRTVSGRVKAWVKKLGEWDGDGEVGE